MSWWPRQRLGGILFVVYFVSVRLVYSLNNETSTEGIPETHSNISSGNRLLDLLLRECKVPTLACMQKTLYYYIEDTLDNTDSYEIKGFLKVDKNNVSINHTDDDTIYGNVARSNKVEELGNKVLKFVLTHNMQLQMPDMMFAGATLEVSPKSIEGSGLITTLGFIPKLIRKQFGTPRIFFKKIKKFVGEKLLHALLAIVLVVALLVIKFLFFLPLLMGLAAAKKLLVKLLLFFFPFLTHLFKLCPYVHDAHGLTKFHHHHHQIAHLHHVPPHIQHHPVEHHSSNEHHGHHGDYDIGLEYYGGGPDLSAEFINRKTDPTRTVLGDQNQIHSWGQSGDSSNRHKKPQYNRPLTAAEIEALTLKAEHEAVLKVRLQQEHNRVQAENKLLQSQIHQSLKMQQQLKLQVHQMQQHNKRYDVGGAAGPISGVMKSSQTPTLPQVAEALHQQKPNYSAVVQPTSGTNFDTFYSPILEKIDKVLTGIGFIDEPCRERIICSMYKNPTRFSPHSNLISAELSRDSSELQKPTSTNAAVVRFYKYVQAARNGQDKRECLRLYPACSVNTEK